jgi:hypothetical protein
MDNHRSYVNDGPRTRHQAILRHVENSRPVDGRRDRERLRLENNMLIKIPRNTQKILQNTAEMLNQDWVVSRI